MLNAHVKLATALGHSPMGTSKLQHGSLALVEVAEHLGTAVRAHNVHCSSSSLVLSPYLCMVASAVLLSEGGVLGCPGACIGEAEAEAAGRAEAEGDGEAEAEGDGEAEAEAAGEAEDGDDLFR